MTAIRRQALPHPEQRPAILSDIFARLDPAYDYARWHWQPETPPDYVCISAILVQHTNWANVEQAIEGMRAAGAFSLDAVLRLSERELAELVRPAGTPSVKATRLRALAQLAAEQGGLERLLALPVPGLRPLLLATHGIGPETADAILLYAAARPVFEIDAYTVRLFRRLGLGPERNTYDAWQRWFQEGLTPSPRPAATPLPRPGRGAGRVGAGDTETYQRYHGLIVLHGKQTCRPKPRCAGCCLLEVCETGSAAGALQSAKHSGGR